MGPAAQPRILLVEAPEVCQFLHTLLERFGYEALELSTRQAVDLLLSESTAAALIVTNRPGPLLDAGLTVPIVYIASVPDEEESDRCAAVLRKPFHYRELLDTLHAVLTVVDDFQTARV